MRHRTDPFAEFDRSFRLMRAFIFGVIGLVFTLILCWWIFLGVLAFKVGTSAIDTDWSSGIKPVIEQVWCGEVGCLSKENK